MLTLCTVKVHCFDEGKTLEMLALESLNGGQIITLSTLLIKPDICPPPSPSTNGDWSKNIIGIAL